MNRVTPNQKSPQTQEASLRPSAIARPLQTKLWRSSCQRREAAKHTTSQVDAEADAGEGGVADRAHGRRPDMPGVAV